MNSYSIIACVILLTAIADYALKYASLSNSPYVSRWFASGALIYGATAIGWVALMRTHDLAHIAVLYSAATIIALTLVGVIAFGEMLATKQIIGLCAALLSVVLVQSKA